MKFDAFYKQVFLSEQNAPSDSNTEVAHPDDFDDVDPLPIPSEPTTSDSESASPSPSSLGDFMTQLEEFANKLNGTDGSSLQTLVHSLDKADTPFEGIYGRTSAEIVDAAKTLRSISEKLKNFIIQSAKR